MPFVESMFNYRARSNAGASGVWQFTRATGRMYLQMDSAVDARSDVLLAAEGAAKLLADNYRRVESWPLALTAYNHGISGMVRAVRQLGTRDIGVISEKYRSRTFGFASRNFYSEFVAAVVAYADRARIFRGIRPRPELRFDEFVPGRFVSMLDLAHLTDTDVGELHRAQSGPARGRRTRHVARSRHVSAPRPGWSQPGVPASLRAPSRRAQTGPAADSRPTVFGAETRLAHSLAGSARASRRYSARTSFRGPTESTSASSWRFQEPPMAGTRSSGCRTPLMPAPRARRAQIGSGRRRIWSGVDRRLRRSPGATARPSLA